MAKGDDLLKSPHKPIGSHNPRSKGSPGDYDGEPGSQYAKRTNSPNAAPEKTYESAIPRPGEIGIKSAFDHKDITGKK